MAGGLGRHALWLAQKNWKVSVVDISEVALQKLHNTSTALNLNLNLNLNLIQSDGAEYEFQPEQFDLIVLFYYLERRLFPRIISALKPGGMFICKMRMHWGTEQDSRLADGPLLGRHELASLLPDLMQVNHHQWPVAVRGVVEFVGKKLESSR